MALVLGAVGQFLLLPAEEPREVRAMRPLHVARRAVGGLHPARVAGHEPEALACHVTPPWGQVPRARATAQLCRARENRREPMHPQGEFWGTHGRSVKRR